MQTSADNYIGKRVRIRRGTRLGTDTGERFDWGGRKYDWNVIDDEATEAIFEVVAYAGPHATMNGGGFDYQLRNVATGVLATLRTTFQRPESQTWVEVSR